MKRTLLGVGILGAALLGAQCGTLRRSSGPTEGELAFGTVYEVLQHPRCLNCHPAGRVPLQGDDSRPHGQNVQGGDDGQGLFAMRCGNCHFGSNGPGEHLPPGAPGWHLPTAAMPLVFQGRSATELARQLADPRQNGGKTLAELLRHVEQDPLVLWGWNPGPGRTAVPAPHSRFVAAMRTWIDAGCPVPETR